jgi:sugar lactone lactonase YvrE
MRAAGSLFATEPELRFVGHDLERPECVLACASGRLFMSDGRGGVTTIAPDGTQNRIGQSSLVPNGIALCRDGSFLIADLSPEGGVWRIGADGRVSPFLQEIDGRVLPRVNFVALDMRERLWICVSALVTDDAYPIHARTGFIALADKAGTRIVADDLQYTNECRIDADFRYLYVNETFGRCLTRFTIAEDGALGERQTFAEFSPGDFPDGLTLDAEGGLWVVCVGSNRVYRVGQDQQIETVIDDSVPETVAKLEAAFKSDSLTRPALSAAAGRRLKNPSSLAFGGADLRTAYIGCLNGTSLASFRSPVAGLPQVHWNWS